MEAVRKIESMDQLVELFLAICTIYNDEETFFFSENFIEIVEDVMNEQIYRKNLSDNLYNLNNKFNISDFLKKLYLNFNKVKKYFKDDLMYDIISDETFTEVDNDKALKICEKYSYFDIELITLIVSKILLNDRNMVTKTTNIENNEEMKDFANMFFSEYCLQKSDINGRIEFTKDFRKNFEEVVNNDYIKEEIIKYYPNVYGEDDKFKTDVFMHYLKMSNVRKYWADAWQCNEEVIFTEINKDVASIKVKENENVNNLMKNIIDEYNKYSDNKSLIYKAMTEIGTSNSD